VIKSGSGAESDDTCERARERRGAAAGAGAAAAAATAAAQERNYTFFIPSFFSPT